MRLMKVVIIGLRQGPKLFVPESKEEGFVRSFSRTVAVILTGTRLLVLAEYYIPCLF